MKVWREAIKLSLAIVGSAALPLCGQETLPRIEIQDVPLTAVVASLGAQAELNFFVDPKVSGEKKASVQWTNLSVAQAFQRLLTENQLIAVTNRATSVMRIVPATAYTSSSTTNSLGADTGRAMPRIGMEFVSLPEALTKLGDAAQLTLKIDPDVRAGLEKLGPVSFAWRNITPKQALTALADNYGISLVKDSGESAFRIQLPTAK